MDIGILENVIDSHDMSIGGGSASAIAGSMAAGMIAMVCRLSVNKPQGLEPADYEAITAEADQLAADLLAGANADGQAYLGIKAAFKLPKDTEEQKVLRSRAVNEAAVRAAAVPRDNARLCRRAHELALSLIAKSNPACFSDLMSAKYLAYAGVKGCCLNIEANLGLIKDEEAAAGFQRDIAALKGFF